MPGAGTNAEFTKNNQPLARLLDLTRLVARAGQGPLTGVDRVERAYLIALLAADLPMFALVKTALGFMLLDASGAANFAGMLMSGLPRTRKETTAKLRRFARARCTMRGLAKMLANNLPLGTAYLNVGHENLADPVFAAVKTINGTSAVLVHDTIALDYPQFQGRGAPQRFEAKLRSVGANADLVIYNSAQSRQNAERYFVQWGRVPTGVVAHLAVDPVIPDAKKLPKGYDFSRPYFVSTGTIEPRKNHALLLDVWAEFDRTMASGDIPQLFIVGRRGWNNDALFHRLDTDPYMGRSVHEISGLDDAGLAALLKGSAGLLFPSLVEGFGLPLVEAAAMNVPVICKELAIYREILGNYPIYVTPDDCYSWAKIIGRLAYSENNIDVVECRGSNLPSLSTWGGHFNIVLNMT